MTNPTGDRANPRERQVHATARRSTSGRGLRIITWLLAVVVVLATGAIAYAGWVYSEELLTPAAHDPEYDLTVIDAGDGFVTLPLDADTARRGVFGLDWPDGYGAVLDVESSDDEQVTREYSPHPEIGGTPAPGDEVRIDPWVYPVDPRVGLDLAFEDVVVTSDVGELGAWFVPADGESGAGSAGRTWAVFVHGRGATPREGLRVLRSLNSAGVPSLLLTWRNSHDAPASEDGLSHLGASEWRDVEAGVDFALEQGAEDVVLVAASMGGMLAFEFLDESPLADEVVGLILDAPLVNWEIVMDDEARRRGLPRFLVDVAQLVTSIRVGVNWADLDQIAFAEEVEVPVLVFHGEDDQRIPVASSERLAAALDEVDLNTVAGAGHVQSWNVDRTLYEEEIFVFLDAVGAPGGP